METLPPVKYTIGSHGTTNGSSYLKMQYAQIANPR